MKQSTRRLFAYGSNASLVTFFVLVALAAIYLVLENNRVRLDMSEDSQNTLAVETMEKLRLVDLDGQPVQITAFSFKRGEPESLEKDRAVKELLQEIGIHSEMIDWEHVDYDKEKVTAERLSVQEYGHVVLQMGEKRVDIKARELFRREGRGAEQRMEFVGEEALGRALSQLTSDSRRVVYVLEGHGERRFDDSGPSGLSDWSAALAGERYEVKSLRLMSTNEQGVATEIPEDASVLVLASPTGQLDEETESRLLGWLVQGGSLLVLLDEEGSTPALLPNHLGIDQREGVLRQPIHKVGLPTWLEAQPLEHAITTDVLANRLVPFMISPVPISIRESASQQARLSTILKTQSGSWIERGGDGETLDSELDEEAVTSLGLAMELLPGKGIVRAGKQAARVVIYTDVEFLTNRALSDGPGNLTLARDTIYWLAGEDRRLEIQSTIGRSPQSRRLALTQQELGPIRWISLGLMPLLVGIIGLMVWMGRRGR